MIDLNSDLEARLNDAHRKGMALAVWAAHTPDRTAVFDPDGCEHTFAKINATANRLTRYLRSQGLAAGDAVAIICSNRVEYVEVLAACLRGGWCMTPINWHSTAAEITYIVQDCGAKAVICESITTACGEALAAARGLVCLSIGKDPSDPIDFRTVIEPFDESDIDDSFLGNTMLYTSGTTGRPKGVVKPRFGIEAPDYYRERLYDDTAVQMCAGPAYHAAPLLVDIKPLLRAGVPLVFLSKWDSETTLRTISQRRITHMHMVPTMFQRLLALPYQIKALYDISHVRMVIHGGAPCPPQVKRAMIDWFGPVFLEYYGASEGGSGFQIDTEEWLKKPGSVGKQPTELGSKILDEAGAECPAGVSGLIYHQLPPDGGFRYHNDDVKTQSARIGDYFTLGDVGFFDAEGYLFLTGRSADTIISGGVNIYPQEIDHVLLQHAAVADCAVIGVPNDGWGEEVKAVIVLKPGYEGSEMLERQILDFGREGLSRYKVPKSVDFVEDLPRSEAGKIQRNKLRARYWPDCDRQI